MAESRILFRLNCSLPVIYKFSNNPVKKTRSTDLSTGGMAFETDEVLEKGSVINLQFDLPDIGHVQTKAEIILCRERKIPGENSYLVGTKFSGLTDEDSDRVTRYLLSELDLFPLRPAILALSAVCALISLMMVGGLILTSFYPGTSLKQAVDQILPGTFSLQPRLALRIVLGLVFLFYGSRFYYFKKSAPEGLAFTLITGIAVQFYFILTKFSTLSESATSKLIFGTEVGLLAAFSFALYMIKTKHVAEIYKTVLSFSDHLERQKISL